MYRDLDLPPRRPPQVINLPSASMEQKSFDLRTDLFNQIGDLIRETDGLAQIYPQYVYFPTVRYADEATLQALMKNNRPLLPNIIIYDSRETDIEEHEPVLVSYGQQTKVVERTKPVSRSNYYFWLEPDPKPVETEIERIKITRDVLSIESPSLHLDIAVHRADNGDFNLTTQTDGEYALSRTSGVQRIGSKRGEDKTLLIIFDHGVSKKPIVGVVTLPVGWQKGIVKNGRLRARETVPQENLNDSQEKLYRFTREELMLISDIYNLPVDAFDGIQERINSFPLYEGYATNVPNGTRSGNLKGKRVDMLAAQGSIAITIHTNPTAFAQIAKEHDFRESEFLEAISNDGAPGKIVINARIVDDVLQIVSEELVFNEGAGKFTKVASGIVRPEVFAHVLSSIESPQPSTQRNYAINRYSGNGDHCDKKSHLSPYQQLQTVERLLAQARPSHSENLVYDASAKKSSSEPKSRFERKARQAAEKKAGQRRKK